MKANLGLKVIIQMKIANRKILLMMNRRPIIVKKKK